MGKGNHAVVKLGGALFKRDPEIEALKKTASLLRQLTDEAKLRLVLVAGGGENARTYINAARKLGAEESTCDLIGIRISRANAELLRVAIGPDVSTAMATRLEDLPGLITSNPIVVMGGLQPGQSTNAVAALAAEIIRAGILVNATDVEGVFTEDPKKSPHAKLMKRMKVDELLKMALAGEVFAGRYELLDPVAVKIMQRSRIPSRFVSMTDPGNIVKAIRGTDIGTLVTYE